jgi:hypothetical protein
MKLKEVLFFCITTMAMGYSLKLLLKWADMQTNDMAVYLGASLLAYKFLKPSKRALGLGTLMDHDDPDVQLLCNLEDYIHPDIKKLKAKEIGPRNSSIYVVKFLRPEYCEALVRVAEKYGDWDSKSKGDYGKGMTLPLDFIPILEKQYSDAVKKYLFPIAENLFPTFKPTHHDEVYILRYRADRGKQNKMDPHYDGEPLACILTLNRDFRGGGTIYPKFNYTALANPGEMMLYPGGLSHLHGGKQITAGRRYALLHALYDKALFGDSVSPWEEGEPQHEKGRK